MIQYFLENTGGSSQKETGKKKRKGGKKVKLFQFCEKFRQYLHLHLHFISIHVQM